MPWSQRPTSHSLLSVTVSLLCVSTVTAAALVATAPSSTAATGGPIQLSENTGKCVDRDVATGKVQLWDCLGGTNQVWTINSDGTVTTGGACLETPPGLTANNTLVEVATCSGGTNQQWSHNGAALLNIASGRCLDLTQGDQNNGQQQLQVYDCIGNPNQAWTLPATAAGWTAAWGSAMQEGLPLNGNANFSCRNISRITLSGTDVRVRLSNLYDSDPVTFTEVRIAQHGSGASIVSGTSQAVTFSGSHSVTVPPGGEVVSDGVRMLVSAGEDLDVSLFIAGSAATYPNHANGKVTHYCTPLSNGGNHVDDVAGSAYTGVSANVPWVSGIDVAGGKGAVVVIGDSITDGTSATADAYNRWPDVLATRLESAGTGLSVVNAGISGNGVVAGFNGDPAEVRFGRDVLGQANVSTVIILLGTNDIAKGESAQAIINGLADLAGRAHAAGVRVIGATLLPRHGGWPWPDAQDQATADAERDQINNWIRTDTAAFDSVIDFDAVMANTDPAYDPGPSTASYWEYMKADYVTQTDGSVDRTHPNPAGLAAMANAVNLAALTGGTDTRTGEVAWSYNGVTKCVDRDVQTGHAQIWDCLGGSNQLWTHNADGTVTTGGDCLELPPGQTANHTLADVQPCTGGSNQRWISGPNNSLLNQAAGRCLDLDGGNYANGRQLQVYDCVGGPNQSWTWS